MTSTARLLNSILNPPAPLNARAYSGYYYAFYGYGGFSVDQSFNPIMIKDQGNISFQLYDVTYAVQLKYDVKAFNEKIGLVKDVSNRTILSTSYDFKEGLFPIDSISITAEEFINELSAPKVISVGAYQTLYSEYLESINKYFFNVSTLDDSLLSAESTKDISNGVFDANQLMDLISYKSVPPTYDLNGVITVSSINSLLKYAVDKNVFGNRVPLHGDPSANITPPPIVLENIFTNSTVTDLSNNIVTTNTYDPETNTTTIVIQDNSNNSTTTIVDDISNNTSSVTTTENNNSTITDGSFSSIITPTYADVSFSQIPGNYGISQGFLAGDLIFIPAGLTVTLELVIDPLVDASTSSIKDLIASTGLEYEYVIDLNNISTQKTTAICKILTAPLLLELENLS